METEKIIKVTVEYKVQGKQYKNIYENESGLTRLNMPSFPQKNAVVRFLATNGREFTIGFDNLCKLKLGDAAQLTDEEKKTAEILLDGLNYNFIIDEINVSEERTPYIHYEDATEHILLGLPALASEIIDGTDKGLWSSSGERLLAVNVKNFPFYNQKCNSSLIFTDYDGKNTYDPKPSATIKCSGENVFLCSIDTHSFQAYMSNSKVTMKGCFSIANEPKPGEAKITYEFPVSLVINNSDLCDSSNKYLCVDKNSKVSIDFGTSSTCAAIKTNIISMIEMSIDAEGSSVYSVYENPTNLMMYRWKEFSEKWNNIDTQPLLRRFNTDYQDYSMAAFDFGHPVKSINIEDQRCLDSIINQLKMIPKMIADGKTLKIRDYENSDELELTSESGSETTFNPIEFYGYLLGKAINHPNGTSNCYYTKYLLSYPVKFSESIRETIEKSITEGIKRSLPAPVRNLTDEKGKKIFQVKMKYSEPIACIGAACGDELVIKDGKPCLFGVFDFGGGTADYSFGMYRSADLDTEGYDEALELFGVDGDDSFGGELIINKISYWILTDPGNKSVILENGIPFDKPKDEFIEDGYGNLILSTIGAVANIRKINELISRPYFEGKQPKVIFESVDTYKTENGRTVYSGTTMAEVEDMFSVNSENEKVTVNIKIEFEELNKKLKELFKAKCSAFSQSMDNAFTLPESEKKMSQAGVSYNKEDVQILMSGNSSRHPLIKECLGELFNKDNICLIGEERADSGNRYKVTPKTAVAIGALKLEQMLVNEPESISTIYVAAEIKQKFVVLLKGDFNDSSWHRAGVINDGTFTVYCSTTPDVDNQLLWKDISLEFDDYDERMVCYIRQCRRDQIEYLAAPIGSNPNENNNEEYEIIKKNLI